MRIKKIIKRTLLILLILVVLLSLGGYLYTFHPKFGKTPTGSRLERVKQSPNYKDGSFQNQHFTPNLAEDVSYWEVITDYFFGEHPNRIPVDKIPSQKTDLLKLSPEQDVLVWFGHSSYFIQIDGKKILVDPVFSGDASPIPGGNEAFTGTDRYSVEDLPAIDYLFLSHDHYDHIDYETILKLKGKVKKVICGLGVGEHLEYWGYDVNIIIEKDWNEKIELDSGFIAYTTPARHFSGRGFSRDQSLWVGFVLQTPTMKLYLGGDSGYDTHFVEIGKQYGPFDLAILENGQYDLKWKYIHMLPEEVLKAAQDLKAKKLFPVHSSKFAMANHKWFEPLREITELNKNYSVPMMTPVIGEKVNLKDSTQKFHQWWKGLE